MAVERLVETLTQRITPHVDEWFPDHPHERVQVRVHADRPKSVLLTVHLDGRRTAVALAKLRRDSEGGSGPAGRPRLRQEAASAEELTRLEWAGLESIEQACGDVAGLGVVRPLLLMPAEAGLVMSYVDAPTLRSVVVGLSRLRPGGGRLEDAVAGCALAGRWLRAFQSGAGHPGRPARQGSREEVVDRLHAYGDYLGSRAWRRLAAAGAELATEVLPRDLPLTVGHGDFAPRNMFFGNGRLTVIDPMPRWRVPVYDDLCRLLVGIRLIGEQVHTRGLAFGPDIPDALEEATLAAYLGPDADRGPLRAYQLLILMDKWSAMRANPRRDLVGRLARRSARWADRRVRDEAERLLGLAVDAR